MRHVLIATHGRIASGFKSALKLFLNGADDIVTIDAYTGKADENYEAELLDFLQQIEVTDEAYIFTDIKAGSVNQKVVAFLNGCGRKVILVTNVNLPILVGLLIEEGVKTPAEIKAMVQGIEPEVISLSALFKTKKIETEDEFF